MWNSIKKLFTNYSKINELNKEISKLKKSNFYLLENYKLKTNKLKEETEQYKIKYEGILRDTRKLNDKYEKLEDENYTLRETEQHQQTTEISTKGELDNQVKLERKKDRVKLYNILMEGKIGHQNIFYHEFIKWTFEEIFKCKMKEIGEKPYSSSNKHIILDTSIIMEPYDSEGNHIPLMDILNKIEKLREANILQPVLSEKLIGEYKNQLSDLKPKDDGQFTKLTIFPALEMAKFFNSCVGIEETNAIKEAAEQIRNKIPQWLKDDFNATSKPDNYDNDILFAAIAQTHQCLLVTNDIALLELGKLKEYKLQIFHNSTKKGFKSYPHINQHIKPLIPVDKK